MAFPSGSVQLRRWSVLGADSRLVTVAVVVIAGAWLTALARVMTGDESSGMAVSAGVGAFLVAWAIMVVAMMGPAALAGVRYTAAHSLRWRRRRAAAEYALGYLIPWLGFGLVFVALLSYAPALAESRLVVPATLGAAAVWQVLPVRRRALLACHRSHRLPLRGRRAELAAVDFGFRNGTACVGTCWCLMTAVSVTPGPRLLWMVLATAAIVRERSATAPRRAGRTVAAGLAMLAIAADCILVASG